MTQYTEIDNLLRQTLGDQLVSLKWKDQACKIVIEKSGKQLEITWAYPLLEAYFDFYEKQEKIFHDWIEMYDGETNSEMCQYIKYVSQRFFNMPSRLETNGKIMKVQTIEVFDGNKWENVFE